MTEYKRFAVYYAPPAGPFADAAAAWLGWNPSSGRTVPHPNWGGLQQPINALTQQPRKYGFHGTIKPPFRLQSGKTRSQLVEEMSTLAARLSPVQCDGLQLHCIDGFLALTPTSNMAPLAQLAATVVKDLDHFRAEASAAELTRRRSAGLSAAQEANLVKWGYPYVMEQFQFHLTLSGKLDPTDVQNVTGILDTHLLPLTPRPFEINELCLFGEAEDGRFHVVHRSTLSG
ncbi:DUF1045 domain-containing protein [Celeribacter marinus]|uniref:DUF1045 domain-containing protein n=1 Tax=Celeribacter marinus TaxID=1397108 RepID=UPI003F6C2659